MCISIKWITIRGFCEPIHNVFQHRRMLGPSCIHYVLVVRHWCTHRKIGNLLGRRNADAWHPLKYLLLDIWIGIILRIKEYKKIHVMAEIENYCIQMVCMYLWYGHPDWQENVNLSEIMQWNNDAWKLSIRLFQSIWNWAKR